MCVAHLGWKPPPLEVVKSKHSFPSRSSKKQVLNDIQLLLSRHLLSILLLSELDPTVLAKPHKPTNRSFELILQWVIRLLQKPPYSDPHK
jgi:hypothetical protein